MVGLDFSIRDGNDNKMCVNDYIIESMELDYDVGLYPCTQPASSYVALPRLTDGMVGDETCTVRGRVHRYLMKARPYLRGTNGKCMKLLAYTSDGFYHELELRFSN
jgi:hypothetical protein